MQAGALLIDTRSSEDRERDGIVPGSLHIPRTVLEWRAGAGQRLAQPARRRASSARSSLLCDHGYSTIFATATLVDLGFTRRRAT